MADYLNIAGRVRTTAADGVVAEAQEIKDLLKNKSQQEINADVDNELGDRYTKEETYSKEQLDDLITTPDVNYVSVVATDATTAVTDVLPATGEANTIYRVGNWNGTQYDPTMYALFAWNGSAYVCLAVRSFVGEVYDISANHPDGQGNPTPYADLSAALGTDGANIPADIRRGGMSIKFIQGTVQNSDNKYVQAICMAQNFTTDTTQWQGVDNEPTPKSKNLAVSGSVYKYAAKETVAKVDNPDSEDGYIKTDGTYKSSESYCIVKPVTLNPGETFVVNQGEETYIGSGVALLYETDSSGNFIRTLLSMDTEGASNVENCKYENTTDSVMYVGTSTYPRQKKYAIEKIVVAASKTYVNNHVIVSQNTLTIGGEDKGELAGQLIDIPEWVDVKTDSEGKILYGVKTDGKFYFGDGCPPQVQEYVLAHKEEIIATLATKVDKVIGKSLIDANVAENTSYIQNAEYIEVKTDNEYRICEGIKKDGTKVIEVPIEFQGAIRQETNENYYWLEVKTDKVGKIIEGINTIGEKHISKFDTETEEMIKTIAGGASEDDFYLENPYRGANFDNQVCSQSHEHCYTKQYLENAYNRGIRVIACSHYRPSCPRLPISDFDTPYQDYKSKQAVLDGDYELVTRHCDSEHIPTIDTDDGTIQTDNIPQIANAERAYVNDIDGHYNILGLLWGSAGNALCNNELTSADNAMKKEYSLESTDKFNELLEDESMWQFGSKYAFGTMNHPTNGSSTAIEMLTKCPDIFKAMEIFNQAYSEGTNQIFKNYYDEVLKAGYRIWATAVVDWQTEWASWVRTTSAEKTYWQDKYNSLSAAEKAEWESAYNELSTAEKKACGNVVYGYYYMETGRYKFDRGTNVLLMDGSYNGLTTAQKAKAAIMAYLDGRYYMSGLNSRSMELHTDNKLVNFKVSDLADKIVVVTAKRRIEYTDIDSVNIVAKADDMFIRFEAYWDDGEFIFTNPVWVNLQNQ